MKAWLNDNRIAVFFILKFAGLYLVLNTLYGLFVSAWLPVADPITEMISKQVAMLLSVIHLPVVAEGSTTDPFIMLVTDYGVIVNVFEGCNSVNVMIVFVSFLVAFTGRARATAFFMVAGLVIIYIMNVLRVGLLFEVAYFYPDQLYFFHKYFFTAIIYLVVFVLWYIWVKRVRAYEK